MTSMSCMNQLLTSFVPLYGKYSLNNHLHSFASFIANGESGVKIMWHSSNVGWNNQEGLTLRDSLLNPILTFFFFFFHYSAITISFSWTISKCFGSLTLHIVFTYSEWIILKLKWVNIATKTWYFYEGFLYSVCMHVLYLQYNLYECIESLTCTQI